MFNNLAGVIAIQKQHFICRHKRGGGHPKTETALGVVCVPHTFCKKFSEGGQKILNKVDRLLYKVEADIAENTNYIMYVANLHLGDSDNFPIVVQLWDGKNGVASVELCKTFDTKEEAEAYIEKIYRDYPAPKGRENGPVIIYAGASTEGAERPQLDEDETEVV